MSRSYQFLQSKRPHQQALDSLRWCGIVWAIALGLLPLTGCGNSTGYERYVPAVPLAQNALVAALDAWKKGEPAGTISGHSPGIQVVDSNRRRGQTLASYEILGEVPGDLPRCFAVRLHLENPRAEEKVRFIVLGIDPLWVYHHRDYELICHWEHPMPANDETQDAKMKESPVGDGPQAAAEGKRAE